MTTHILQVKPFTAVKVLGLVLSMALLAACSTNADRQDDLTRSGVAVIGVTARSGLDVAVNRNLLASEFSEMLAERRAFSVLPAISLRRFLGPARLDDLLSRYAEQGVLADQDVQLLMAAGLPTPRAVLVRIEDDFVTKMPVRREPVFNQAGSALVDRERRVLSTQRVTRLSAIVVDLKTGRLIWDRQYQVDPMTETSSTKYLGSSFSGSVAAAVAERVVNGRRVDKHPDAPPLRDSLRSLLREIVTNMPLS